MGLITELLRAFSPSHDAFLFMWLLTSLGVVAMVIVFERWKNLRRCSDYNAARLFESVKQKIDDKKMDEAFALCASGGVRALPRILAAGIKKAQLDPLLASGAMAEESTHMAAFMSKRMNLLVMFGNVFTLFGLLGTVYGLITSFNAVSKPSIAAIEKSAMLASGISTAMNSTLVGLSLSVITVMLYAFIHARLESVLIEIDRYGIAALNFLVPPDVTRKKLVSLTRTSADDDDIPDADVTPMLNLMVILIPVLLTSSEFVKVGAIELKLPTAAQAGAGAGGGASIGQSAKLDLGIVITTKGFNVFSYFKAENQAATMASMQGTQPDIPLVGTKYDFAALNNKLMEIKKKALLQIIVSSYAGVTDQTSLLELYKSYMSKDFSNVQLFADHECVKIIADDKITYETVVGVMDAARGASVDGNHVTMFPNVTIAGGIIQ